jgi:MinD-like ATPase involved in chromosome partitioning or flagellar assembly/FixJ family two-component response regulator
MAKTPSVLIVDADIQARFETKQVVRACGLTMAGECGFGMEAASTASELQPDVILVGVAEPMERPIQTIESLQAFMPETPILVYSQTKELETVRKAMMAGAKDFLARPVKPDTLRNSVLSALLAEEKKRLRQIGQIPTSATTGTIVTVFGAKGGIGKSTVSVNLAVAMAQMERASVCLVDLDDGFADLADMLDLKPEIRDTSGSLNELMERAVEVATVVLWVTTTEYASVKDSIEAMRVLQRLSFSPDRIRIVMNAVSPDDGVAPAVVQEALQRDVFWLVPYDKKVRQSTHLGQPAVITAPNSVAARSLTDLARAITGAGPANDREGRLPSLKRRASRNGNGNGNGSEPS